MSKMFKLRPVDAHVDSIRPKIDVDTLEAFGITLTKPPKGYYSIEELCKGLSINTRGLMRKLEKLKKQNRVTDVTVYVKNKTGKMCYKKFYKISKAK